MRRTHKQQIELKQLIDQAQSKISVGELYWHHKSKDKVYKVLCLAFLEANDDLCVVYKAQYGEQLTFVRPLSVWLESVEWEGKIVPRFSKV